MEKYEDKIFILVRLNNEMLREDVEMRITSNVRPRVIAVEAEVEDVMQRRKSVLWYYEIFGI